MYRGYFHIFRHFSTRLWGTVPPSKQLEFLNLQLEFLALRFIFLTLRLNHTSKASIFNAFATYPILCQLKPSLYSIQEVNLNSRIFRPICSIKINLRSLELLFVNYVGHIENTMLLLRKTR